MLFSSSPSLPWAAWHYAAGLVYLWNSEKTYLLRDKMKCTAGLVKCCLVVPLACLGQHGTTQQGWYTFGTLRKPTTKRQNEV